MLFYCHIYAVVFSFFLSQQAYLRHAILSNSNLEYVTLDKPLLFDAFLKYTNLTYAPLPNANLEDADLSQANLNYTNLSGVNLTAANLNFANLTEATGLTQKQLAQAYSPHGTITPDGSIHP